MAGLVAGSLSIAEAAVRLGVTPARIRQRIANGRLWAFDSGRNRLLPRLDSPPVGPCRTSTESCPTSRGTCIR